MKPRRNFPPAPNFLQVPAVSLGAQYGPAVLFIIFALRVPLIAGAIGPRLPGSLRSGCPSPSRFIRVVAYRPALWPGEFFAWNFDKRCMSSTDRILRVREASCRERA